VVRNVNLGLLILCFGVNGFVYLFQYELPGHIR